jgi:DNA-directed RNA polymerase subunit F
MTHFRLPALSLLVAVLVCFQLAKGQQKSSNTDQKALQEKAYRLIESLADQLGTLQSAENRARMGSNIAESLWSRDDKRARDLLVSVEQDINAGLQEHENDPGANYTFMVFLRLREDTVERIAKHDPELAFGFLKRTEPVSSTPLPREVVEREREFQLRLAKRFAATSPETSVKLARQTLDRQVSNDLLVLLIRLSSKDKQQAQILYRDVVAKLREANFKQYWPEIEFAKNLLQFFTPPAADESTYRELIDVLLAKALERGCGKPSSNEEDDRTGLCRQFGAMLPLMEKFSPAQAGRLKHWDPEHQGYRQGSGSLAFYELNDLAENGTIDEILGLASRYPEIAGQAYLRAIWRAEADGDFEEAKKIASGYTGNDPYVRQTMTNRMDHYERAARMTDERLAEVQQKLAAMPMMQRIQVLLILAKDIEPADSKKAVKLLDQANAMIDALPLGGMQTGFQIQMAMVYCLARNERGFGIIESLMPRFNELVAAAAKLDGYDTHYLSNDEWNMSANGVIGSLLTVLAHNAGYFAWCDFDRAVALSTQFERGEIRMMAQLKLAQAILAGPPKRIVGAAVIQ